MDGVPPCAARRPEGSPPERGASRLLGFPAGLLTRPPAPLHSPEPASKGQPVRVFPSPTPCCPRLGPHSLPGPSSPPSRRLSALFPWPLSSTGSLETLSSALSPQSSVPGPAPLTPGSPSRLPPSPWPHGGVSTGPVGPPPRAARPLPSTPTPTPGPARVPSAPLSRSLTCLPSPGRHHLELTESQGAETDSTRLRPKGAEGAGAAWAGLGLRVVRRLASLPGGCGGCGLRIWNPVERGPLCICPSGPTAGPVTSSWSLEAGMTRCPGRGREPCPNHVTGEGWAWAEGLLREDRRLGCCWRPCAVSPQ